MVDLRSRKANFVCQHASVTCHIRFVCKGHLIHTRFKPESPLFFHIDTAVDALLLKHVRNQCREPRMDVRALLSGFQGLLSTQSSSNSDMQSGRSKEESEVEEEEEEEERISRTSSCRSASTSSYYGGSEASSSIDEVSSSITEETSDHSPPPSLPVNRKSFYSFVCYFFLSLLCISPDSELLKLL